MPDGAKDKKVHAAIKPVNNPLRPRVDGDLTCSESQMEDIFSEGESSRPMTKSDKGLLPKRQPKTPQ